MKQGCFTMSRINFFKLGKNMSKFFTAQLILTELITLKKNNCVHHSIMWGFTKIYSNSNESFSFVDQVLMQFKMAPYLTIGSGTVRTSA
jgi:hypothetical protein